MSNTNDERMMGGFVDGRNAEERTGGLFRDVTPMSVLAPALAAATSFVFISRVGLIGSLVGTVVTAAISAAATQVYKNMMADSADRLRQLTPDIRDDATPVMSATGKAEGMAGGVPSDATARLTTTIASPDGTDRPARSSAMHVTGALAAQTGTPIADTHMRQVAIARRAREVRQKALLFSCVLAVIVALLIANLIVATFGNDDGLTVILAGGAQEPGPVATTPADTGKAEAQATGIPGDNVGASAGTTDNSTANTTDTPGIEGGEGGGASDANDTPAEDTQHPGESTGGTSSGDTGMDDGDSSGSGSTSQPEDSTDSAPGAGGAANVPGPPVTDDTAMAS